MSGKQTSMSTSTGSTSTSSDSGWGFELPDNAWLQELLDQGVDLSDILPALPDLGMPDIGLPDLSLPDLSLPDLSLPEISFPDFGLPDLGDLIGGGQDEGPAEGGPAVGGPGEEGPGEAPAAPAPIEIDEELFTGGAAIEDHLDAYLTALDAVFEDPSLASVSAGANSGKLSTAVKKAWVALGTTNGDTTDIRNALHDAAEAVVIEALDAGDKKKVAAAFAKVEGKLEDTYVFARIVGADSYGLDYPSGADVGKEDLDIGALLDKGRDPTQATDADGNALDIAGTLPEDASLADRAAHLASMLAADTLPAEHVVTAHDSAEALYTGDHADVIEAAGLPASSADVYRKLQELTAYASQRDNESRMEDAYGGTCNLTALSMAIMAAGIAVPDTYKGVPLTGMQIEERLLTIANMDGKTAITTSAVWKHVTEVCGGNFEDLGKYGEIAWATWESVQTNHLDKGHGVFLSNNGHVVRLQEVASNGLVVDDPYGKSTVKDTSSNGSKLKRTYKNNESGETVEITVTAWKKSGTWYATYTDEGGFADPYTDASLTEKFLADLAAQTETEAAGWSQVGKEKKSGGDRPTLDSNDRSRDRSADEYDNGDDTTWGKAGVEEHYMGGVFIVWR